MAASVGDAKDLAFTTSGSIPTGQTQTRVRCPSCSTWSGAVSKLNHLTTTKKMPRVVVGLKT